MTRCLRLLACFLALTCARAEDYVSWEMTPPVAGPGQPFKLQVRIESDVILGPADRVGRELKPPKGMALRFSGQLFRANTTEATLNFSGVAPEEEGAHVVPSFNIRFPAKLIKVPAMTVNVSAATGFRREGQARAELAMPVRTYYVGERIPGAILLKGSEQEMVNGSFGLECEAEGFTFQQVGARNEELPNGQGIQTGFELTPLRTGTSEVTINGIMLVNTGGLGGFTASGRDRPFTFRRKVTVEHVPETGRPTEWTGAIGRFLAESVSVSNPKPEVGEPIRLRAILTGSGNLDRLITPEIPGSEQWDVLPAQERRRHSEEQRFFVYTLVPRLPGKLLTPAIRFSTFDPLTKQYARVEFKPIEVVVTGTAPAKVDLITADPAAPADTKKKTVAGLAAPEPRRTSALFLGTPSAPLASSPAFWSGNAILVTLLIVLTAAVLYLGYLAAHPQIRIRRRARSILRASLAAAETARRQGDQRAFALAIVRALQVGSAARLGAEEAAMIRSDIERALPGADRALLDGLFLRANGERSGADATDAGAAAALGLVRRLLALL